MNAIPDEVLRAASAQSAPPPLDTPHAGAFDVEAFIGRHGLKVRRQGAWNGAGQRWELEECPFNPAEHTGGCAVITRGGNGALGFKCQHHSCADKHWHDLRELLEPRAQTAATEAAPAAKVNGKPREFPASGNKFEATGDGSYRLSVPAIATRFDVDRLRRERHELIGELCVRCELPRARAVGGTLSLADFNLSSARARSERARLLTERANTSGIDWLRLIEELCQRVIEADRAGQPAVDLRTVPRPAADGSDELRVEGFVFPRRHPAMAFGDGGTFKSYLALYLAGRLAEQGLRIGFFDWELAAEDHRIRLERLFPDGMPLINYVRCERPLVTEADRLHSIVRDGQIDFCMYDSVALACDGPPEAAEVAGAYFRAVRQIGGGSLHLAHISKAENGDKKPFGSAFWHNLARATWFIKAAESLDGRTLSLGVFCRKSNLGPIQPPLGFEVTFEKEITVLRRTNVADNPDMCGQLSVRQKMVHLLRRGALSPEEIAEGIDAELNTVKRESRRYKKLFTIIPGGKVGLVDRSQGCGGQLVRTTPDNVSGGQRTPL